MNVKEFVKALNSDFFAGVPDSRLRALCDYLYDTYGVNGTNHIIAANEGNAAGLAAGYYLATGKTPVVYMQNSGEGNAINPIASLLNDKVYGIPCVFVIGWRGEPGVHDEPQHIFQGEITCELLDLMDINYMILSQETTVEEVALKMKEFKKYLDSGKQTAFVVRKGAFEFDKKVEYKNNYTMLREDIIKHIVDVSGDDIIVSTTGKTSRELFEIRETNLQDHCRDFLTVGSMGHSSSIALGIALQKPERKIWIIDGDGAALMHMGAMAVLAANNPKNVVHVILNNGSHETVGGQPAVTGGVDFIKIAEGYGYQRAVSVDSFEELDKALKTAKASKALSFIEVKCAIGARENLGRPTTTAKQNKTAFMSGLNKNLM